ncbi:mycofactocin biosynthesis glycosyltransferase MftF [Nocardiopsis rhodophaea]|uniref:mycofactocin biosynthesis glycosyltransferase MftF n=1 Tax=Nocardiopsis rhodophaea TaxID=280238 RepID=UPI0031DE0277
MPLPESVGVFLDRGIRVIESGRVLIGGSPTRVIRLSAAGARAVGRWRKGDLPRGWAERVLARRLVAAGVAHPCVDPLTRPPGGVTVVIPVRDRQRELRRLLAALDATDPGTPVIVVDDASAAPEATGNISQRFGAEVVYRTERGGAAAARNTGLERCDTAFVAFIDSDCVPEPGWLDRTLAHLADPVVAAAAPRILALDSGDDGALARFEAARSPLDMGPDPASVGPGGPVSYVPSAALVVRREACPGGFDADMPVGEDVDLVWRLTDAGWAVRYEPTATVRHDHRLRLGALLARRFDYGTSAGPLAARHGDRVAPAVISPWSAAILGLMLAGRPAAAAALTVTAIGLLARRLSGIRSPVPEAARMVGLGTLGSARGMLFAMGRVWTPAVLAAVVLTAVRSPRAAALAGGALALPHVVEWRRCRPALDPARWTGVGLTADAAYAAGVWRGAIRERTLVPLLPRLSTALPRPHSDTTGGSPRSTPA